ncbi:hypothetical protein, partial [Photobacterium sanguinicancri]|uniref:hypothetical protein n=1 Tax=Photobacterium sanguinicancri TaxID=875932 RepID=UPI0026E13D40
VAGSSPVRSATYTKPKSHDLGFFTSILSPDIQTNLDANIINLVDIENIDINSIYSLLDLK